jgi:hypothetical protein
MTGSIFHRIDAERKGGLPAVNEISPFAQKKRVPIAIDEVSRERVKRIPEWRTTWLADTARTKRCP